MHEYSIVAALVDQVEGVAGARGSDVVVRRVHLRLGEAAGVDRRLLETAYATFRERTCCAAAELVVHESEARWACPKCGEARPRGERLRCPTCAVPARMLSGDEILLERVEMEVP